MVSEKEKEQDEVMDGEGLIIAGVVIVLVMGLLIKVFLIKKLTDINGFHGKIKKNLNNKENVIKIGK